MKKILITILVGLLLILGGCGKDKSTTGDDKKEITVGFGVGTYEEQFRNGRTKDMMSRLKHLAKTCK